CARAPIVAAGTFDHW
nr:immunoglobulin heavy chain junction region [Macaca mulatta]MOX00880.1 immunoglobulin heavy chain junction region [Macaca mulatta]MOX01407.1 immunoglobulin heavy chain junction region [Macaca mulatta]MOX03172.1 immunoglobulin heavy chain junction region [Macaca mulatta]MOX04527.1 immunoglobulin heavy chain junction region [Macaca mulatta]